MSRPVFFSRTRPFRRLLFLVPLFFFSSIITSCEFWEDWCDGDKPPPPDPITHDPEIRTVHTRDEALSLVCNKLVMKFSMMPEKPSIFCRASDDMARGVAALLRKANAICLGPSDPSRLCSLESAPADPGSWHPVAVQVSTGKVLLDEVIPLAAGGNGGL